MQETAVYVGRPTRYGNPFKPGDLVDDRPLSGDECIDLFRHWLEIKLKADPGFLSELRGKDLVCWCAVINPVTKEPAPCHADILLEYANA